MRKHRLFSLFVTNIVLVVLQVAFFSYFFGPKVNPNLIIILALAYLFSGDIKAAYISVFIGGLFYDLIGNGLIGITPFISSIYIGFYAWLENFYLRSSIVKISISTLFVYFLTLGQLHAYVVDWQIFLGSFLTSFTAYLFANSKVFKYEQKINL